MVGNEYQELVADIQERGQLHPVVLHNDQLLDGRNRLKACEELGITPTLIAWDAPDGVTAAEWIVSTNLQRRHLTSQQRAMLAADPDILNVLEAEARERQTKGGKVKEKIPEAALPNLVQKIAQAWLAQLCGKNATMTLSKKLLNLKARMPEP